MTAPPRPRAQDQSVPDARLDDAALIERSWHEPEAFATLYDRHAAPIHRFAGRRLGDQMADDVVAETFLAAFRRRKRYDLSRADARPWLYGIAANVMGKHRRAEVRMLRAFARTGIDPLADGHADRVDSQVSAAAVQRDLAAPLADLSAGDRGRAPAHRLGRPVLRGDRSGAAHPRRDGALPAEPGSKKGARGVRRPGPNLIEPGARR
jgi:DNA-directed RNA polymerase specialized sigma24 family protein